MSGGMPWYSMITERLAEPSMITGLQIVSYTLATSAGGLVVFGAVPFLFLGILSPWVAFGVGLVWQPNAQGG